MDQSDVQIRPMGMGREHVLDRLLVPSHDPDFCSALGAFLAQRLVLFQSLRQIAVKEMMPQVLLLLGHIQGPG